MVIFYLKISLIEQVMLTYQRMTKLLYLFVYFYTHIINLSIASFSVQINGTVVCILCHIISSMVIFLILKFSLNKIP